MPYGVKRGVKAPGEYGFFDMTGLAMAGSAGIIAAVIADHEAKGDGAAIYTLNRWATGAADLAGLGHLPLWVVIIGLITLGAASIFYFQPITRQGAFAQGFGLLAVIMTATPSSLSGALIQAGGLEDLPGLETVSFQQAAGKIDQARSAKSSGAAINASLASERAEARVYKAQATRAARYVVELTIEFPDGVPDDVNTLIRRGELRGRLHNEQTGQTYNLFRGAGGNYDIVGDAIIIRVGVPARADEATLWVRIECNGHAIEESSAVARVGEELQWDITLRESNMPMRLQRLGKSYWF